MKELTPRQQEIYDYLVRHLDENGYPPTLREICTEFGMKSTRAASDHLDALAKKSYIMRTPDRSRGIELMGARRGYAGQSLPVVGRIAAGEPVLAQENITDRFTVDANFLRGDGNFLLEVEGESMIEAHICPGDYIIVRPQDDAASGDIVVALLEDEATVKRLDRKGGRVRLLPENHTMAPIDILNPADLKILGKVVGLMRRF